MAWEKEEGCEGEVVLVMDIPDPTLKNKEIFGSGFLVSASSEYFY